MLFLFWLFTPSQNLCGVFSCKFLFLITEKNRQNSWTCGCQNQQICQTVSKECCMEFLMVSVTRLSEFLMSIKWTNSRVMQPVERHHQLQREKPFWPDAERRDLSRQRQEPRKTGYSFKVTDNVFGWLVGYLLNLHVVTLWTLTGKRHQSFELWNDIKSLI